jgi:MOSC domain-containing protein YiiM
VTRTSSSTVNGCPVAAGIRTVNVVYRVRRGYFHDTAIDKRPVGGLVEVTRLGLAGDRQLDSSHGGADKAVYAYSPDEDAQWWADELDRQIPPGLFGENLRTHGLETSGAVIGERWSAGTALFEVRMPRTPCPNLALRMGMEGFHSGSTTPAGWVRSSGCSNQASYALETP